MSKWRKRKLRNFPIDKPSTDSTAGSTTTSSKPWYEDYTTDWYYRDPLGRGSGTSSYYGYYYSDPYYYSSSYYSGLYGGYSTYWGYSKSALEDVGYSEKYVAEIGLRKIGSAPKLFGKMHSQMSNSLASRVYSNQKIVDLFSAFYKVNPRLRDYSSYIGALGRLTAEDIARYSAIKAFLDSPQFEDLRERFGTALNPLKAALGTISTYDYFKRIMEAILERFRSRIQGLIQKRNSLNPKDSEEVSQFTKEFEREIGEMANSVGFWADYAISAALQAMECLNAVAESASQADDLFSDGEDNSSCESGECSRGYSKDLKASWQAIVDTIMRIWEHFSDIKVVFRWMRLLGRLREIVASEVKPTRSSIRTRIEFTSGLDKLGKILISELGYPEDIFLYKLASSGYLYRELGETKDIAEGLGDIVAVLDSSGSMDGMPYLASLLFTYLLGDIAYKQGRRIGLVTFSDTAKDYGIQSSVAQLMNNAARFGGGGTNIDAGFLKALELIRNSGLNKPDILLVTDMLWEPSDDLMEMLSVMQKQGTRLFIVAVIGGGVFEEQAYIRVDEEFYENSLAWMGSNFRRIIQMSERYIIINQKLISRIINEPNLEDGGKVFEEAIRDVTRQIKNKTKTGNEEEG